MRIVAGTYEGNLISWESDYAEDVSGRTLKLAYAFHAHDGSVRAVAFDSEGKGLPSFLVSGSADENMKIYNMKTYREVGSLMSHKDAISAMAFVGDSHLLSGCKDGTVCIWRCSDWLCMDTLRAHK